MPESDEAKLVIRLFGGFEARVQGAPLVPLRSQKGRWLLALLVLRRGQEVPRSWLAETLWPDSLQSEALTSLRQSLADLRKALGPEGRRLISSSTRTLRLDLEGATVDVLEFDHLMARADRESQRRAVTLYTGALLEGCLEAWVFPERETRREAYLRAVETLAAQAWSAGATDESIALWRRGVRADPWHEPTQRALLQALAKSGDYANAIQAYQTLRNSLYETFRIEPQPETQTLYRQIREQAKQFAQPTPPLRPATSARAGNVPRPLTRLIGRETQAQTTHANLLLARLVTVTGIGGVGKTRLALHVADQLREAYHDGVWFIDLSALDSPAAVPQEVAAILGIREERGQTWTQALKTALQSRQMLLALDNCEHLLEACAELARTLLSACPNLRILATSRQKLGLVGEMTIRLEGLALPDSTEGTDLAALSQYGAIQLFVERAKATQASFQLAEEKAASVIALCRQLDGLPLALELAAARVETLTVQEIVAQLQSRRGLLASDETLRAKRHQTLQAVMDWSYDLLTGAEQTLLRRLSVFAGGWTLAAAESVCAGKGIETWEILKLLSRLIARSLVVTEEREGTTRYRLLETVRQDAQVRQGRTTEAVWLAERHFDFYLRLAEESKPALSGPEQSAWLEQLEVEQDNFRAALNLRSVAICSLLRLVGALGRFWQIRSDWSEGREQLTGILARSDASCPAADRAEALGWASLFATYQGDGEEGRRFAEEALKLWKETQNAPGITKALGCLGIAALDRGDYAEAQRVFEQSLETARHAEDIPGLASALGYLGIIANARADYPVAQRCYKESLALRRHLKDIWGIAASLNNLGLLARHQNRWDEARLLLEESLELRRRLHDRRSLAITLNILGTVMAHLGEQEQARRLLGEGLRLCQNLGDRRNMAYALEAFAHLAARQEEWSRSALLLGAAQRLRDEIGSPLPPSEHLSQEEQISVLKREMGAAEYEADWHRGRAMETKQALLLCF